MSSREKNLVLFFVIGGFLLLNFWGYSQLTAYRTKVHGERVVAERTLNDGLMFQSKREEIDDQITWLLDHEPEPASGPDVQARLQQFADREAQTLNLTVRPNTTKLLTTDSSGVHFNRAKVEFSVTGTEQALYAWIAKLQSPTEFRAVTSLRLMPNHDDDTKIDATLIIEQWFVPIPNA